MGLSVMGLNIRAITIISRTAAMMIPARRELGKAGGGVGGVGKNVMIFAGGGSGTLITVGGT